MASLNAAVRQTEETDSETPSRQHSCARFLAYCGLSVGLVALYALLANSDWRGGTQLHTISEVVATLVALIVGILALTRYYTKKSNSHLFIGTAFLGTPFLDGYHAIVTSTAFDQLFPSAPLQTRRGVGALPS